MIVGFRSTGFTLAEILAVLLLLSLLAVLALPAYHRQLATFQRQQVTTLMLEVVSRQEQYLMTHQHYAQALDVLGYESTTLSIDRQGRIGTGGAADAMYRIRLVSLPPGYQVLAESVAGDHDCSALGLTWRGRWQATGRLSLGECWQR